MEDFPSNAALVFPPRIVTIAFSKIKSGLYFPRPVCPPIHVELIIFLWQEFALISISWGNWIICRKREYECIGRGIYFGRKTCYSPLSGEVIWFARTDFGSKQRQWIKSTSVRQNGTRPGWTWGLVRGGEYSFKCDPDGRKSHSCEVHSGYGLPKSWIFPACVLMPKILLG